MPTSTDVGILRRLVVMTVLLAAGYLVIWRGSYALFAPQPEVVRSLMPQGPFVPGETVVLGAVVENTGWLDGAAFSIVALGNGVEVEGPTVDVPSRDSATVPVRLALPPGEHVVSLLVFDGWRGVRRLETFQDILLKVAYQEIDVAEVAIPRRVDRGDRIRVAIPWVNPGEVVQTVRPVIVVRSVERPLPVPFEGPAIDVASGQAPSLEFDVDTWSLRPGRYRAEILVLARDGQRIGRGNEPLPLEVSEG